jgi:hypothetical protein
MKVQHCNVATRVSGVVCLVRPGISPTRLWMPTQLEYLNNPFPYGLTLKRLFHGHTLDVLCFGPMQPMNRIL